MADLHYFPFFAKDWLTGQGTVLMTPEQKGAFIDLLAHAWMSEPACTLPDDDAALAKLSGLGLPRWRKIGAAIRAQFGLVDGRLRNPKLYAVWLEQQEKHAKRVEAGRTGGRAKAAATPSTASVLPAHSPSNALAMLDQCSSNGGSIELAKSYQPEPEPEEVLRTLVASDDATGETRGAPALPPAVALVPSDPPRAPATYPPEFETCWAAYPSRGTHGNSKAAAFRQWMARRRQGVIAERLLEGTRRYAAYCDATRKTGTEFVKTATVFFGRDEHFAEGWAIPSEHAHGASNGNGAALAPDAFPVARRLWAAIKRAGLLTAGMGREQFAEALALAADELAVGPDVLGIFLRSADMGALRTARTDEWAERHLASRLTPAVLITLHVEAVPA